MLPSIRSAARSRSSRMNPHRDPAYKHSAKLLGRVGMQPGIIRLFVVCAALAYSAATVADGMMVRRMSEWEWARNRERSMINEPEQKAVVYFHQGRQRLIISPSFDGAPAEFAWIIPVPSRPSVQILDGAIFHELARLTMPKPSKANGKGYKGTAETPALQSVQVLERKVVGAYDVSVLAARNGVALTKWLRDNGYRIPEAAQKPIAQ